MTFLNIELLLQLVYLDLQFNAVFPLVVAHFEHVELQLVVAHSESLVFVSQIALYLLCLEHLYL